MTNKEALNRLYYMACIEAGFISKHITYAKEIEHNEKVKEAFNVLEKTIQHMEELEQAQNLKIESLQCIETETKYQVAIRVLKEAFITLGRSDIADTCWFKYLEELEKKSRIKNIL